MMLLMVIGIGTASLPSEAQLIEDFKDLEPTIFDGGDCRVDELGIHIGITGNREVTLSCGERGGELVHGIASDALGLIPGDIVRSVVYKTNAATRHGKTNYVVFVEKKVS